MFCLVIAITLLLTTKAASQTYEVPTIDGRIVGGTPTSIKKYPYQVSLQYHSSHICGGAIISKDYVVTAAHCTDK